MKNIKRFITVFACTMLVITSITLVPTQAKKSSIKLNKKSVSLKVGKKVQLKLKGAKAAKVKWSSTKKSVAKVSKKGLVKGIKPGKATIKAKYKKKTYKAKVTVKKKGQKNNFDNLKKTSEYDQGASLLDSLYENKNILISPASLNMALGMAANGADDTGRKAIENYLGKSLNDANVFANNLVNRSDGTLKIANSFWYKNSEEPNESFCNVIDQNYHGEVIGTPMDNTTISDVNDWVDEKTDHMIPKVLKDGDIDSERTKSILINALLFDAYWTDPFRTVNTYKDDFTRFDGSKQKVEMMLDEDSVYYENAKALAFEKTYGENKEYSFFGILPKKEGKFNVEDLDLGTLLNNKVYGKEVHYYMPRFTYTWDGALDNVLKKTPLKVLFDPLNTHLDRILNTDKNLYIDKILQNCKIEVDEKGTKAVAVTPIIIWAGSARRDPVPTQFICLDRPFAFVIKDNKTNEVLFIGKVTDIETPSRPKD